MRQTLNAASKMSFIGVLRRFTWKEYRPGSKTAFVSRLGIFRESSLNFYFCYIQRLMACRITHWTNLTAFSTFDKQSAGIFLEKISNTQLFVLVTNQQKSPLALLNMCAQFHDVRK